MTKILVTGAAGFVGTHTMLAIKELGHDVLGIDNFSSQPDLRMGLTANDIWTVDITDRDKLNSALVVGEFIPDVIIHLAAQPSLLASVNDPYFDASTNILGTLNIIRLANYFESRLVFSSTSAVYGDNGGHPYTEASIVNPDSPYGLSKATAEHYIRLLMDDYVILRYGNVYGPLQLPLGDNQLIPRYIRHLLYGDEFEIYGDGTDERDFIYVSDVVDANIHAALGGYCKYRGTFNVSTGYGTSVNDVLWAVSRLHEEATGDTPIIRNGLSRDGRAKITMSNNLLLSQGWKQKIPVLQGMRKTYEWWKTQ